jgi:hypothetical protein
MIDGEKRQEEMILEMAAMLGNYHARCDVTALANIRATPSVNRGAKHARSLSLIENECDIEN